MQINLLKNSNMKIDVRQKSDTYEHLVATGFFTGTYEEYKERTKLGLIGPTQTFK